MYPPLENSTTRIAIVTKHCILYYFWSLSATVLYIKILGDHSKSLSAWSLTINEHFCYYFFWRILNVICFPDRNFGWNSCLKSNRLIFWFIFFSPGNQDEYVLKKVYSELLQYNPKMKKSSKLEKLAQSHGCVRNHADHRNSWQDKAALRNDPGRRKTLSSIIGKVVCFSDRNKL